MTNTYHIDGRDIFIRGKDVLLKALTEDDVLHSNWYGWFNDEEVCGNLQKHYFPNTREGQLEFYKKTVVGDPTKLHLGICDGAGSQLLGITSLYSIDFINRKCGYSIVLGEKNGRNIKMFLETTKLMFAHAFYTLNLHRIYGGSFAQEITEIICRTTGAKPEGVLRQDVYKNGQYRDVYNYGLLREEFKTA